MSLQRVLILCSLFLSAGVASAATVQIANPFGFAMPGNFLSQYISMMIGAVAGYMPIILGGFCAFAVISRALGWAVFAVDPKAKKLSTKKVRVNSSDFGFYRDIYGGNKFAAPRRSGNSVAFSADDSLEEMSRKISGSYSSRYRRGAR